MCIIKNVMSCKYKFTKIWRVLKLWKKLNTQFKMFLQGNQLQEPQECYQTVMISSTRISRYCKDILRRITYQSISLIKVDTKVFTKYLKTNSEVYKRDNKDTFISIIKYQINVWNQSMWYAILTKEKYFKLYNHLNRCR